MSSKEEDLRIEYVPLSKLKRWKRNYKQHDIGQITSSLNRFGFVSPIIIDENTGAIVAGHGRLDTVEELKASGAEAPKRVKVKGKQWLLPIIRGIHFKDEDEGEAYLIADNRSVELGGENQDMLQQMLADLAANNKLEGVGYDEVDMEVMLQDAAPEENVGKQPTDIIDKFEGGTIKQIVLYFPFEQYKDVIERLEAIMGTAPDLESHTDVFMLLLQTYEDNQS